MAADKGCRLAWLYLSSLYAKGNGVSKSIEMADYILKVISFYHLISLINNIYL